MNDDPVKFTHHVYIRCPASLPPAIKRAAAKNMMTPSEYIRRAVIDRLKADGIDPGALVLGDMGGFGEIPNSLRCPQDQTSADKPR